MNKDKINKLRKLIEFLDENEMDLTSCECCYGIGIIIENNDISDIVIQDKADMKKLLKELEKKMNEKIIKK